MPSTRETEAALGRAIEDFDEALVANLLAKGVDIEAAGLLDHEGTLVSPLMLAARCESTGCAALLLRAGAARDRTFGSSQDTPLLVSASRGDADTAKVLIDAGADLNKADAEGRSPIYMSCLMSHPGCTALLVNSSADIEQPKTSINSGATALYAAALGNRCDCCSVACVRILCEAGAVVDAQTAQGVNPMMVACQHGRHGVAMLLSSYGASRQPHRFEGNLPTNWWARDLADDAGHEELVEWLDVSDDFTSLHHIEVLLPSRTLALLRAGACSPVAGRPSPALRATNYLRRHPHDDAAKMIVRASEPWSPMSHSLWSEANRARVVELLKVGYQLRNKLEHGSVLDWWVAHVMPHAVAWGVEPPRPAEPKAKQKEKLCSTSFELDKPSAPATAGGWLRRLRPRSTREGRLLTR